MSAEFCPRCTAPLDASSDPGRLCEVCGLFCDETETLRVPPKPDVINPVLAAAQCLELFRDVCRKELIAEQIYDAGDATERDIRNIRISRRQATDAIIALFTGLHRLTHPSAKHILHRIQGVVPWPKEWTDRHFIETEPCDTLVGPCACGAWHDEFEPWVQAVLQTHNAEIATE